MPKSMREMRASLNEKLATASDEYDLLVMAAVDAGGKNMPTLAGVAALHKVDVRQLKTWRRNAMAAEREADRRRQEAAKTDTAVRSATPVRSGAPQEARRLHG